MCPIQLFVVFLLVAAIVYLLFYRKKQHTTHTKQHDMITLLWQLKKDHEYILAKKISDIHLVAQYKNCHLLCKKDESGNHMLVCVEYDLDNLIDYCASQGIHMKAGTDYAEQYIRTSSIHCERQETRSISFEQFLNQHNHTRDESQPLAEPHLLPNPPAGRKPYPKNTRDQQDIDESKSIHMLDTSELRQELLF